MTVTRKLTTTLSPGASGPTGMPVNGLYPGSGVPPILTLLVSNTVCGGRASVRFSMAAILPVLLARMEKESRLPTEACAGPTLLTSPMTGMKTGVDTVLDRAVPLNEPAVNEALARLLSCGGLGIEVALT